MADRCCCRRAGYEEAAKADLDQPSAPAALGGDLVTVAIGEFLEFRSMGTGRGLASRRRSQRRTGHGRSCRSGRG